MKLMETLKNNPATSRPVTGKPFRVVFWGWGWAYLHCLNQILHMMESGQIEAVGVTGNRLPPFARMDGIPVIRPEEIPDTAPDYIIITEDLHEKEIYKEALETGIPAEKLLSWKIFGIPYFDFCKYVKLKERKISVISNDCWGGFLSESLLMEHRSPFKNLFLKDWDYLKCLNSLKYYCSEAVPVFERWQKGGERDEYAEYPVLRLDDIELYCNHDQDPDEAIARWMRRRIKVNYEDLFVEMRTELRESEEQFCALEQYPHKICFVPYESKQACSLQVVSADQRLTWAEAVHKNVRIGSNMFLFSMIDLLCDGEHILRGET